MGTLSRSYDAVIVGAGVSGTAAAILLRQKGLSVLLADRRPSIHDYKLLCTHFVQPFTNSIFDDLGIRYLFGPDYSVETKAVFRVPGGVIDAAGGYGSDPETAYAHNLERRVLDPALRQRSIDVGVTLSLGTELVSYSSDGTTSVLGLDRAGERFLVETKIAIGADGRSSCLANIVGADASTFPNDRAAYFAYFSGIEAPPGNRSIFVLRNSEMSFLYPLINGRSLLSVYITSDRAAQWGTGHEARTHLLEHFRSQIPDMDFSRAIAESQTYSYRRYDNQVRSPVHNGVAFVGDAVVSIDPMSGVGCSFGFKSARLLTEAIVKNLDNPLQALAGYETSHNEFFEPHVKGIIADSRVTKSDEAVAATYQPILRDPSLQRLYLDLTARLITPAHFQRSYMTSAMRRGASPKIPSVSSSRV